MNLIFSIPEPFRVPDGTLVSPFLNAKDSESDLPFDLLEGFSLSAGTIEPMTRSRIHVMPFVMQATFVRRGCLELKMKGPDDVSPYTLSLSEGQTALTEPGALLQLINNNASSCEVLYIVSPAYTFEIDDAGSVVYDDSLTLKVDWDELEAADGRLADPLPTRAQRDATTKSLEMKRRKI